MNKKLEIKALFNFEQLYIDIGLEAQIIVQVICGSQLAQTIKTHNIKNKQAIIQEEISVNTKVKYIQNKFQEKKAKIRIILLFKGIYKKAGKIHLNLDKYLNSKQSKIKEKLNLEECADSKASLHFSVQFQQKVLQSEVSISNEIKLTERRIMINNDSQFCEQLQIKTKEISNSEHEQLKSKLYYLENELNQSKIVNKELMRDKINIELILCQQKQKIGLIMQILNNFGNNNLIEQVEDIVKSDS